MVDDIASVDCGSCRACCRGELVLLLPEEDPAAYDTEAITTPAGITYVLRHQENGDCIYLGPDGCTIHGHHPAICRTFDCAAFARLWPRRRRRASGMPMTDILAEGLRRAKHG